MAEEQNWEETTNHTSCANNCLCSKCYKDHCLKDQHISTAKFAVENSLILPQHQLETSPSSSCGSIRILVSQDVVHDSAPDHVVVKSQPRNMCESCKRRVGLTGFTCRCGMTFCGTHRYPEKHGCTFDFKTMGKEAIAKANPVIKAAKLDKI